MPDPELNEQDRSRIHAAYEHGVRSMTPEDLDKVLADEKKAKEKARNLKGFFEEFKLLWFLLRDYKAGRYKGGAVEIHRRRCLRPGLPDRPGRCHS